MSRGRPQEARGVGGGAVDRREIAFDSHLHLTDARFEEDRRAVLDRAREAGVAELVTVGTDPEDAAAAVALARETDGLWATAGLHPHDARRFDPALLEALRELAAAPEVVAVGETGLDYHYDNSPREAQRRSFRAQLALGAETGLPVVVHSRSADEDTAAAIREAEGRVRGVLHCFTGGDALLDAGLAAGWWVSFSGIVTFGDEGLEGRARRVPADRLLVETDAPYLAPVPMRGRRNEPAWVRHTCARLAALRGEPEEALVRRTRANARAFYGLGPPDGTGRESDGTGAGTDGTGREDA